MPQNGLFSYVLYDDDDDDDDQVRPSGAGAALSGKRAIFDFTVSAVRKQKLPEWDEALAGRIREGLTLSALEAEVAQAVDGERDAQAEDARNSALSKALAEIVVIKKVAILLVHLHFIALSFLLRVGISPHGY